MAYKTRLGGAGISFSEMMKNGFGIVTVMDVKVFDALSINDYKDKTAYDVLIASNELPVLATINTLKVANVPQEGPSKTVTGGQFSNPLIKFGKSARLEMQDALGRAEAIEALGGGVVEYKDDTTKITGLHFGEDFVGPKLLIGESFFIDQKSGQQVNVKVIFYQFLPDSIFNLTQDAEGDATVFDMNGDLLTTVIQVGKDGSINQEHGVFYSIIDPEENGEPYVREFATQDDVNLAAESLNPGQTIKVGEDEKTIATITESYDGENKVVVYVVTYVNTEQ